jgi:hypothetical protein
LTSFLACLFGEGKGAEDVCGDGDPRRVLVVAMVSRDVVAEWGDACKYEVGRDGRGADVAGRNVTEDDVLMGEQYDAR